MHVLCARGGKLACCAAQEDLAIRIVLILENIVLWAFLAALAYIFRHVPSALIIPLPTTSNLDFHSCP